MKIKHLAIIGCLFGSILKLHSQGYIVPNGVVSNYGGLFFPGEISVLHDPANPNNGGSYTGFSLIPQGANTFLFDPVVDVGVRVFLVSSGDPISLQPIISMSYPELTYPNNYFFSPGVPFYLGLFTGNSFPQNGIYSNPLFGWGEFVNNQGAIQLVDSALVFQADGIFAGTQNIIPAPEPNTFVLAVLGAASLFVFHRGNNSFSKKVSPKY